MNCEFSRLAKTHRKVFELHTAIEPLMDTKKISTAKRLSFMGQNKIEDCGASASLSIKYTAMMGI